MLSYQRFIKKQKIGKHFIYPIFLEIFFKKLNLWPKVQCIFYTESASSWRHIGDRAMRRRIYELAKVILRLADLVTVWKNTVPEDTDGLELSPFGVVSLMVKRPILQ